MVSNTVRGVICFLLMVGVGVSDDVRHDKRMMREQWRIGSDDQEIMYGMIGGACVDRDGYLYLLDIQLKHVLVLDDRGNLLRTIGRAGQGPGEFSAPTDLDLGGDDEIIVSEHWPSRLHRLTVSGEPVMSINPSRHMDHYDDYILHGVDGETGTLACMMSHRTFSGGTVCDATVLARLDESGATKVRYRQWTSRQSLRRDVIDETAGYFPAQAWALLPSGTLVMAPERDEYLLEFMDRDGGTIRRVSREFTAPLRTEGEIRAIKNTKKKTVNGMEVPLEFILEDRDPAIRTIDVMHDSTIWIASARQYRDLPPGAGARFDIFTDGGMYAGDATLYFENDPNRDRFVLLGDGSVLQIKNHVDMSHAAMGITGKPGADLEENATAIVFWK